MTDKKIYSPNGRGWIGFHLVMEDKPPGSEVAKLALYVTSFKRYPDRITETKRLLDQLKISNSLIDRTGVEILRDQSGMTQKAIRIEVPHADTIDDQLVETSAYLVKINQLLRDNINIYDAINALRNAYGRPRRRGASSTDAVAASKEEGDRSR